MIYIPRPLESTGIKGVYLNYGPPQWFIVPLQ